MLYTLYRAADRHLRMSELATQVLLSRSGLTRLVDKLERAGQIVRKAGPVDRRAVHAELTVAGVDMLRTIWPVYRRDIGEYFAAKLSAAEIAHLGGALGRLSAQTKKPAAAAAGETWRFNDF